MSNPYDPDADYQAGRIPWTYFAYPSASADSDGLPPDDLIKRFHEELLRLGIRCGDWRPMFDPRTIYLACPIEERERVVDETRKYAAVHRLTKDFLTRHCERLFASESSDS